MSTRRQWPEKVRGFFPEDQEIAPRPVGSEASDRLNFGEVRFISKQHEDEHNEEHIEDGDDI